jgi:hypothetical protein
MVFECKICGKCFDHKFNMDRHNNSTCKKIEFPIPSSKNFKCEWCLQTFVKKYNLDRHLKNPFSNCKVQRENKNELPLT